MPKFRVIYVNGKFIDIKADKFADGTAKTLPPFYDFYKDCALVRRIFVHALREQPIEHQLPKRKGGSAG